MCEDEKFRLGCSRMRSCLLVLDFDVSDKFIVSICESLKVCELRVV